MMLNILGHKVMIKPHIPNGQSFAKPDITIRNIETVIDPTEVAVSTNILKTPKSKTESG